MLLAFIVAVLGIVVAAWLGLVPTRATKRIPPKDLVLPRPAPTQVAPTPAVTRVPTEPPKLRAAKRDYALLTVASEPWGTLYIDNLEIGPTPVADYRLSTGTYRLRIEQEGYRTKKETIVISGPNPIRKRYSLEPQ